jgi:hypothetical protein
MPHAAERMRKAMEEIQMKRFFGFALTLVLFAAPAFASKKPPTVTIPATVQVGSTQVPAGDYTLTWTGSGSNVQATLALKGKTVVAFSARAVEGKNNQGVETHTQGKVEVLDRIQLSDVTLILAGAPQSGQE